MPGQGRGNAFGKGGRGADGPVDAGHGRGDEQDSDGGGPFGTNDGAGSADGAGEEGAAEHGRSAESPGHLKRAAGAQSARDFAPGRSRRQ